MKLFQTSGIQRIKFRSRGKQIALPNPILPASNHILFQVGSSFLATETFRVHGTQQNRKRNYTPACSWRNTLEKSTGRTFISQQLACHASPNLFDFQWRLLCTSRTAKASVGKQQSCQWTPLGLRRKWKPLSGHWVAKLQIDTCTRWRVFTAR